MLLGLALCLAALPQESTAEFEPVVLGSRTVLDSAVLDEPRDLWIYRSPNARLDQPAATIYLLDGPAHFRHVAGLLHSLVATEILPPCLLVAVANTDRWRDLTPTATSEARTSGGGAAFLRFLSDELVPWVDSSYQTSGYRVLIGHSLGGLIALESARTQPGLFDAVIAQSPSLEWNGSAILGRLQPWIAGEREQELQLYLSRANEGELRAPFEQLLGQLAQAPASLSWTASVFDQENHNSVVVPATLDGLRWVFATWSANPAQLARMTPEEIEVFYRLAGERFEVARPIPANALIEGCAQALNNHDQPAQAVELAMFAEDLYPADPYAPLLLGQALERTGETQQARAAYRRALERLATDDDHHRAQALRGLERLQD